MTDHQTFPVLPLRSLVLFPGHVAPIGAGRRATVAAIEAALKADGRIFAVTQREPGDEVRPEGLYSMGVVAKLTPVERGPRGLRVKLEVEHRATALRYREGGSYLTAAVTNVRDMPPIDPQDPSFAALSEETRAAGKRYAELRGIPARWVQHLLNHAKEPGSFTDLLAGHLELSTSEKQDLLETLSVEERMRRVFVHVQRLIATAEAQRDIKSKVEEEFGKRQREAVLREQLKAIQSELGGEGGDKDGEFRERIMALNLPEAVQKEVLRDLDRLERAGEGSMDAQVIRSYLEVILELPWNERSEDNLDLGQAAEILDEDHFGLSDVKDRVQEFLAVRQLQARDSATAPEEEYTLHTEDDESPEGVQDETSTSPEGERARALAKGPILLFTGPPGVGKTSIAKSIARALGREYVRIALGGVRDEADIRGHRRTYVGAMAGRIVDGLKRAGTRNPVFLLDEVDKLGASMHGDPASALLEVLDPAQNDSFTDHYLNVPFDLSEVLFVATANFVQNIPGPLLDRMEVIEFGGYTEREKAGIAERYLIPRQLKENGLGNEGIEFAPDAVSRIISEYTRESGVRQLERTLGTVARKLARRIATEEAIDRRVAAEHVRELLGRPKVRPEKVLAEPAPGLATGMFYTPVGGDIMFVEASLREVASSKPASLDEEPEGMGHVSLILTGQLGDVMKESARAALTYVGTHSAELDLLGARRGALEAHIHVPAGAIPKDGPSAGITIATALASALSGRSVRPDVAMTGEVTLLGRVLPIGGLKEKVLGAHRAGVKTIILPKENEPDIEDIPQEVRDQLTFLPVSQLEEVLRAALLPRVVDPAVLGAATPDSPTATKH